MTTTELPASIKALFGPINSINPADVHYTATPNFVGYPPNHLKGWSWAVERVADEDGSKWLVRTYSPTYQNKSYDVIFCQLTN